MTQPASTYNDDLRLAHVLADSVDAQTMDRFKALDLQIETKPDLTPVTDADKAAEEAIRGQLSRSRPRDAVLGEEFGSSGHGSRRWIIDPIDGTKNFVRGVPVWATLIALVDEGEPVVGVVSAPALGKRWWAAKGAFQYYFPGSGRIFLAGNFTYAHSRNIGKLYPAGGTEIELLGSIADKSLSGDASLLFDATPAIRFGISGQYTRVRYLDDTPQRPMEPHNFRGIAQALYTF